MCEERDVHETGIAMEVLRIADESLSGRPVRRVTALRLTVGRWSGVEPEALRFALEALSAGSRFDGCRVEISVVDPRFRCDACGEEYAGEHYLEPCPSCGQTAGALVAGDEMTLDAIEVEEA